MTQLKYSYALKLLPLAMIAGLLPLFSRGLFWSEDWLGAADFSVVCVALMAPLCLLTGSLELIHHRKKWLSEFVATPGMEPASAGFWSHQ